MRTTDRHLLGGMAAGLVIGLVVGIAIGFNLAPDGPSTSAARFRSPPSTGADPTVTSRQVVTSAPAIATRPPVEPGPAREITAREWQLVAREPDAFYGRRIVVYGEVTQFDAATGTDTFRANVDAVEREVRYGYADYETNTVLTGTRALLADVVVKDIFRAEVTVLGSLSYDTQIGGSTTVPSLQVTAIEVIGSTA